MPQCKISHWGGTEQTGWAAKPGAEEDTKLHQYKVGGVFL